MLQASEISVSYSGHQVVRGFSISMKTGRLVALLGPNGAGKTSALKALNGSLAAAGGAILLDGIPLERFSRRQIATKIAVVAQEAETGFPVSVLEYVLGGRYVHGAYFGWESERDITIARDCIKLCDLGGFERRYMNQLSGGERQRAVLARAIATEAGVLLLDEPTANLDLAHQLEMFKLVKERCSGCGASALVITHDINLAAAFADEIVMMKDGIIRASGTPEEVLTSENLSAVFSVETVLDRNPVNGHIRVTTLHT